MLSNFDVYQKSKEFYWAGKKIKLPKHLADQFLRASSSVTLNIAEGAGKRTPADQARFYGIALGSLRECQAIIELEKIEDPFLKECLDRLARMLYKLSDRKTVSVTGSATDIGNQN